MKKFDLSKCVHIIMKIDKLKNYIIPNLMALSGYWYWWKLHELDLQAERIYVEPGADGSSEALSHTMQCIFNLAFFSFLTAVLALFAIAEYFIRKKYFPNGVREKKLPVVIEVLYSILFWIGMWFPLTRLAFAILFVIASVIAELFQEISMVFS